MRKYVFHVCTVTLIILLPMIVFSWWAEPIHGDLTRIGKWTERDFGPRAAPPSIQVIATGEDLKNPDVLVLGDSFSEKNLWQSIFQQKSGLSVQSFHYDKNCLNNWLKFAIYDPASKIIVIQTVERSLIVRFNQISKCKDTKSIPIIIKSELADGQRKLWPMTTDFSYLGYSALNTFESFLRDENYLQKFMTINVSLKKNCALFSNYRNDKLLYYADDDLKKSWLGKDIHQSILNILEIQKTVEKNGKKFIFLIAPDKSTIYKKCMFTNKILQGSGDGKGDKDTNDILISAGIHTPQMIHQFQEKINTTIDLYDPDNTHWSQAGYLLAGETMFQFVQNQSNKK